jgi:uncharacterized protein (DUF1330 family)
MPAYVIAEVNVTDPQAYEEYRKLVPGTVEKYGGRFLARGGKVEGKEGNWNPARLVILEFPSLEQARKWYDSPEYAPALALRLRAANAKLLIAEGL